MEVQHRIPADSENQLLAPAPTAQAVTLRRCAKLLIRYRWSRFDEAKETEHLNNAIDQLQQQGATVLDIKTSVSQPSGGAAIIIYTVMYDLPIICRE